MESHVSRVKEVSEKSTVFLTANLIQCILKSQLVRDLVIVRRDMEIFYIRRVNQND